MTNSNHLIVPLVLGFIIDLIIGDPLWLPHPIRFFGNLIAWAEKKLNRGWHRMLNGVFLTLVLTIGTWVVFFALFHCLIPFTYLFYPVATLMVFYGLANHCLISEGLKVNRALANDGLDAGRKQLSFIVGRDTSALSANQIRIAILETLSENLSDGVVAPLFYYTIGGVPLMLTYKMVNTLDSMIGYKSEQFKDFGLFAARLDDVANFIPARITAFLMVLVSFSWRGVLFALMFGNKHSSPNSGYPEAALAGILDCRFGGPNVYHGKTVDKPYIGYNDRIITNSFIKKACAINISVSLLSILLIMIALHF